MQEALIYGVLASLQPQDNHDHHCQNGSVLVFLENIRFLMYVCVRSCLQSAEDIFNTIPQQHLEIHK